MKNDFVNCFNSMKICLYDILMLLPFYDYKQRKNMSDNLQRYVKDCKILFPVYGIKEKLFLEKIISNIDQNMEYKDIVENFGSPSEIVIAYFNEQDDMYLINRAKTYRITIIVLFLLCLLFIWFCSIMPYIHG